MTLKQASLLPAAIVLVVSTIGVRAETEDEKLSRMADDYNAQVADESQEVVCRMVTEVGSRIKKKQCRTKAQIKQDEDEAERFARRPKNSYKSN